MFHINGLPTTPADQAAIASAFSVVLGVAGGMCVLFLLIGAVRYAISAGDPGQLKQSRDTIIYAIVGLIVSASAFFIVQFVLGRITTP